MARWAVLRCLLAHLCDALAFAVLMRAHRGAQTHRAKKFVLHTNAPCHQDFGAYDKAAFTLETPRGATLSADAHWEARCAARRACTSALC